MVGVNYGIAWLAAAFSCVLSGAYSSRYKKVRVCSKVPILPYDRCRHVFVILLLTQLSKLVTVMAFISFTLFFALMASADSQSRIHIWGYPVFLGLGLGIVTATREYLNSLLFTCLFFWCMKVLYIYRANNTSSSRDYCTAIYTA